ncbi:M20/M25/M40 family metallo-hydrolase [Actinomadura barringtoniae]|uniref:M20/M25/M40 family metallo-hydrolase n=1 Tax=Actinomadura barringtoniae TaxID=1427535 RepID=A0A939T793_9ACTN|nr:M20/M25/M40 family metallo-hydrolase [Actinomadura barringtoniae]MBO2445645.1 M20/M25/M40 family metallo-hydrolase [Actinomadura barringtoniae]
MNTPVDLLQAMLSIPSPSGREDELARFLEKAMNDLGMAARRDEAGNVIGDIGAGNGPVVMFLGHLDTVDRPLPVHRDATHLHGRGAADAKGPLAAMISAAASRPSFPGTIRVAGAVEEERLSRGGEHLARTLSPPDALLIGEPSGWSRVVLGYKGKIDISYRVVRDATHSTNPEAKATEVAVGFWHDLLDALGPERDHGSFNLPAATLRGMHGDAIEARLDIDCRVPPGFDAEALTERLHLIANGGDVTVVRHIPAARSPRSDPVVRAVTAAIRRHGGTPRPTLKTGTSDMNTVAPHWPVPMAAYGPGDGSLDHSDNENIEIAEYLKGIDVLTTTLDELATAL